MREVERIADQLKRAHYGEAWHGPSLRELLADVAAEKAAAKPLSNLHSIWEIVLHIEAWERAVTRGLEGKFVRAQLSEEEDWPTVNDASVTAWKGALGSLENANKRLREEILGLTDADLKEIVAGQRYSVYFVLHGIIQHALYHAGQIALLKKA